MIFAQLYRHDLVTGEPDIETTRVVLISRGIEEMHDEATRAARYYGADAYRLYKGNDFIYARELSLKHHLK